MVYILDSAGKKKKISVKPRSPKDKPFSMALFFDFEGLKNKLINKVKTDKIANKTTPIIS